MKAFIKTISNLLISGVLLAIPIYAVGYALQALHKQMKKFAEIASPYFPVDNVVGFTLASIFGWLFVICILLALGLLSKTRMFSSLSKTVEENILSFVPGYKENASKLRKKLDQKVEIMKASEASSE